MNFPYISEAYDNHFWDFSKLRSFGRVLCLFSRLPLSTHQCNRTCNRTEFMFSGKPFWRFKADQLKKREAAKVDRVLSLQKKKLDRLKYAADQEGDLKI